MNHPHDGHQPLGQVFMLSEYQLPLHGNRKKNHVSDRCDDNEKSQKEHGVTWHQGLCPPPLAVPKEQYYPPCRSRQMDGWTDRQIGSWVSSDYFLGKVKAKKTAVRETICLIGKESRFQVCFFFEVPLGFRTNLTCTSLQTGWH